MALKDEFTENGLTEEEQAIIDEMDEESTGEVEEVVPDEAEEVAEEKPEDEEEAAEDEAEDEPNEDEVEKEEEEEEPIAASSDDVGAFVPRFDTGGDAISKIDTKLTSVDSDLNELRNQYEDADMGIDEFLEKRDVLFSQRNEMVTNKAIYENNIRNNEDLSKQLWDHDQKVFFENKDNAIFNDNQVLFGALDSSIRVLANDPGNANRTGNWILNEAKRQVLNVFNQSNEASNPDVKADKKPIVKPKKKEIPVTLANIPSSEENESARDEFAHIDSLIESGDVNGMEMALSAMSDSQQSRYLQQTGA